MGYLAEHPEEFCVGDNDNDGNYIKRKPTPAEIADELANETPPQTPEARVAELLAFVASETSRQIKKIIPQDNQLRLLARGLLITKRMVEGLATETELAAAAELEAFDVEVLQPIRDAGTAIEAEVRAGTITSETEIVDHASYP